MRNFVLACDGDPDDLVDLWNAANGQEQQTLPDAGFDAVLARFQGAMRGLYLAEARPDPDILISALPKGHRHESAVIKSVLAPSPARQTGQLSWEPTEALTEALHEAVSVGAVGGIGAIDSAAAAIAAIPRR
ncbi:hypothetical protein [Streptomyces sp. NPDC059616]|uniref:hypothetical protein n=1 Tax=Streptomyces sp. NPDC059616 TaxID=3346886 RepID=UPI0036B735A2